MWRPMNTEIRIVHNNFELSRGACPRKVFLVLTINQCLVLQTERTLEIPNALSWSLCEYSEGNRTHMKELSPMAHIARRARIINVRQGTRHWTAYSDSCLRLNRGTEHSPQHHGSPQQIVTLPRLFIHAKSEIDLCSSVSVIPTVKNLGIHYNNLQ